MFLNYATRELNLKIVYYGPGLAGKTSNVKYVHRRLAKPTKLITLETETERTLFFDFLPVDAGEINGFAIRLRLYTVPGQIFYQSTRHLVMRAADGVVFVADSQEPAMDRNRESLENLEEDMEAYGYDLDRHPRIIQYNKRDAPSALGLSVLRDLLNPRGLPEQPAVAIIGEGVFPTLKRITQQVLADVRRQMRSPSRSRAS
ncbi:MAG: gliding-motility protein MglA [Myxococcales bacterium]|nr:gliding-motility protein MglA [Myxococcales bacterium]MCB9748665.1 gliding-motility protein MglA [Myxococcales bacterium]